MVAATKTVLGVSWVDARPEVRVRFGDAASRLHPLMGLKLHYQAGMESARRCVGHVPFRSASASYNECSRIAVAGSRTCNSCAAAEGAFAANLHHAHTRELADLDPAVAAHLRQPNLLYLAAFRDGSLKVGTTTEKRRDKRLCEQGAWRAMVVAHAEDGRIVRTLEDLVSEQLGLSQTVAIGRKLSGMTQPLSDDMLERRLEGFVDGVHGVITALGDARLRPDRSPWAFPAECVAEEDQRLHPYPLRLDSGSHDIEVIGACGRMAIVQRPDGADVFVADLAQLYGVELAQGDYEADALAVQDSLF